MKRIFLICSLLMAFMVSPQQLKNDSTTLDGVKIIFRIPPGSSRVLKNDTINLDGYHNLIIQLPEYSITSTVHDRYEEGYIKCYILDSGIAIAIHNGGCAEMGLPESDNVVYECKLGNVAKSILLRHDGKYFRRDNYLKYGTTVLFYSASEDDCKLANYILDNVRFERCKKE